MLLVLNHILLITQVKMAEWIETEKIDYLYYLLLKVKLNDELRLTALGSL